MRVFKFGGASVKDAEAVKNIANVLALYEGEDMAIVVSAMGKTTNALEALTAAYWNKAKDTAEQLEQVRNYHLGIMNGLFGKGHQVFDEVNNCFVEVEWVLEETPSGNYDFIYDQVVSMGELISTKIVSAWLNDNGYPNQWFDVRGIIRTDNTWREGKVDWQATGKQVKSILKPFFKGGKSRKIAVTQGFLGGTSENYTTTLGREGSDYTAAILAHLLGADDVTIWKDVPGVLNADPKWFTETRMLHHISYREAIELAYYGATVIHPKTIKPLQNKNIVLRVKSFLQPQEKGTVIHTDTAQDSLIPSFIFRMNQVLISISPRDFSFIVEENLSAIFGAFARHGVKINLMQNSAINFSVSVDDDTQKVPALINELRSNFEVRYNTGLELVTVRHFDTETIDRVTHGKQVLVDQRSRATARMVMKDLGWAG